VQQDYEKSGVAQSITTALSFAIFGVWTQIVDAAHSRQSRLQIEISSAATSADSTVTRPSERYLSTDYSGARMALTSATKLGLYEVQSPLGAAAWEKCTAHGIRAWAAMVQLRSFGRNAF
jgi:hypothetical protein